MVETLKWAIANAHQRYKAAWLANALNRGDGDPTGPWIALQTYRDTLARLMGSEQGSRGVG